MHRRITIITIITAVLLIIPLVAAQQVGCCCDPVLMNGSYMTKTACDNMNFVFVGPPPNIQTTCSQHCGATLLPTVRCGDLICQATENATTCPADCGPVVTGCETPTYTPTVTNLAIMPVKTEKAMLLSFELPCEADYITIARCEGDCTEFETIATIPPARTFKDEDLLLEFNKDYTYSVTARYKKATKDSDPATIKANTGDLECWQQPSKFCINYYTYDQYKNYLTTFGYGTTDKTDFETSFSRTINKTFGPKFNKAWQCNEYNKLTETTTSCNIKQNEYCIADERGPRCVKQTICSTGFDPFGLTATQDTCEKGITPRYCFFDKSTTTINKCYNCDPKMNCYDYKTKNACERDNCGAGECQWNPVFEDLGTGVCVDKRYNNCKLCNSAGITENSKAQSLVWEECREEKSNALSNNNYPCFFDADRKISKTCDESSCTDYTPTQCGSPEGGIKLNPDNSLAVRSEDTCGIGICEINIATRECVKNADGNQLNRDCPEGDKTCELDHYAPITTLIPTGYAGRVDFINIRLFDKKNASTPPLDNAGKKGYKTYFCIKTSDSDCLEARTFNIITTSNKLSLKNTELKDGKNVIANLQEGNNTLAYYSRDWANNVEVIKETNIYACKNCSPPQLINLTVTGGRVVGNRIYTSATKPKFTFNFDEPVQVTYAEITKPGESIQLSQMTTGRQETHEFIPTRTLLGTYNFTLNGQNANTIYFDPPGLEYQLIVDTELAGVSITPEDGSILNKTIVDVTLEFTKPVILEKITLIAESYDPYVITETPIDVTKSFSGKNNQTFTAKISNITGGKYTISIEAEGFNTLKVYKKSGFFVATQKPGMMLSEPTFGVTPYSVFGATVETPIPSECKYVFDIPTAPGTADYQFLNAFSGLGTTHNASGFIIPYGSIEEHPLHVYCKFDTFGIIQRTFNITLDPEPPKIVTAFAEPAAIAEPYYPDQEIYVTTLKVQLDKAGLCKYSTITSNFATMEGTFPGYNKIPKESHNVEVNVTEQKTHQYWVACKAKNGLLTPPQIISFTVDLTLPLNVTSSTPRGFGTLNFSIGVVGNKRVYCYFGEQEDDTTRCMGACTASYTQRHQITVSSPGEYTYYVKCAHVSGEQSEVLEMPVIIDTTPPTKPTVDDTGLPDDPEYTWSKTKIKVAFKSEDPESGISHYLITLKEATGNKIILKDYISNETTGQPIWITTTTNGSSFLLTNGKQYKFTVKAVNKVGLPSEQGESDGVTVDVTKTPETCQNGEQNLNETDIDCGGECGPCPENKKCNANDDCMSKYCDNGICETASCEDGEMNGLETDVDCGGQPCERCDNDKACMDDTNCKSDYCELNLNICIDAPPCADKKLTEGETDIDCGGSCPPCGEGKTCQANTDCLSGLNCSIEKMCTSQIVETPAQIVVIPEITEEEFPLLTTILYILFIILAIAGITFGIFIYLKPKKPVRPIITERETAKPSVMKKDELQQLKTFAKEEEIPEKDWISLEKEIKKKPLTHKKFESELEKLRKIAHKEKAKPEEPLQKLRAMLDELKEDERKDILTKYKLFRAGLLTKEEIHELFAKLKITSEYYKEHKEEFEKELETYGRKKH